MKGLILSGGKGTRLRPFTHTSAKQLVPVANKPVLFYGIETLLEAGITDIGIIVGETATAIQSVVGNGERWGAKITYIEQEAPLGLAHAVKIARSYLGTSRFVMYLGDNIVETSIRPFVEAFINPLAHWNCLLLLKEVERPESYGIALTDCLIAPDEIVRVARVVEKPRSFLGKQALMGIYFFDSTIFEAIEQIQPSLRNELEITDAIQRLIDTGRHVGASSMNGRWIDTGNFLDMLVGNRMILEHIEANIQGAVEQNSSIEGNVHLPQTARVINSSILGPVVIGEHCIIENSQIGPFVSLHNRCTVQNSTICNSIIMEDTSIINVTGRIEDSLIGRSVVLEQLTHTSAHQLLLGDNSKVGVMS
jgi:glucose-1-phosphate thymidylyltransferase